MDGGSRAIDEGRPKFDERRRGGGTGRQREVPDGERGGERGAEPQREEVRDIGEEGDLQREFGFEKEEEQYYDHWGGDGRDHHHWEQEFRAGVDYVQDCNFWLVLILL